MARHWLEEAYLSGLLAIDTDVLLDAIANHITVKGEFKSGVVSPSLVQNPCRLARFKVFLGDDPQPGASYMATRAGRPDATTQVNFIRGFAAEGAVVKALLEALGEDRLFGHAPTLVFSHRYQGDDWRLKSWDHTRGMPFQGHPDLLVTNQHTELELVQIKCPSVFKFERIDKKGADEALESYRGQMITEMYIGRAMGYPIRRSNLMLVSWETNSRIKTPHCRVFPLDWSDEMAAVPERVALEILEDYDAAYAQGMWPSALPQQDWDKYPCSYCRYSRLASFDVIGCEEQDQWERWATTHQTRLTEAVG